MAAYASLAQGKHTTTGEEFLYTLGVSAIFRVVTFLNVTITSRIQ
jgi:hypothetical protein